ncbi:MAG: hypothetical protein IPL61_00120 [Myxococcales bacterium]|nr:hypothetical protein [Myxococcales bacterium]
MNLRREATKTIWKTVVFAGAMLGTAACGGKAAPATDTTTKTAQPAPDETTPDPCADQANPCGDDSTDPCADPCADRIRGVSEEGDMGRGFVLS